MNNKLIKKLLKNRISAKSLKNIIRLKKNFTENYLSDNGDDDRMETTIDKPTVNFDCRLYDGYEED